MSTPRKTDLGALIRELDHAGVEFIVVGGMATALHGAPITTQDLDIVPARDEANVQRLLSLLQQLDAWIRDPAGRQIRPTARVLASDGQVKMLTDHGPLDSLGRLHDGRGYEELVGHTVMMQDGQSRLRVLDLPTLIEIKKEAGRTRDKLAVPLLMKILERTGDDPRPADPEQD